MIDRFQGYTPIAMTGYFSPDSATASGIMGSPEASDGSGDESISSEHKSSKSENDSQLEKARKK